MDIPAILSRIPMFAELDANELASVADHVTPLTAQPGETVIVEGAQGDRLYILRDGLMAVSKEDEEAGISVRIAEMAAGAVFGEMGLLEPVCTSATVTALEPSRLLGLKKADLDALLYGRAELAAKIWRSLALQIARRLRHTSDMLLLQGHDPPEEGSV